MHPKQMNTIDQITMLKELWNNHIRATEELEEFLRSTNAREMTNVISPLATVVSEVEKCLCLRLGKEIYEKRP